MSCPSSCCDPFWRQCDRSAVGALWVEVPRVARRLAALARARPTAISFDRSAVVQQAKLQVRRSRMGNSVCSVCGAFFLFAQATSCRRRPIIAVTSNTAASPAYTTGIPEVNAASVEPM